MFALLPIQKMEGVPVRRHFLLWADVRFSFDDCVLRTPWESGLPGIMSCFLSLVTFRRRRGDHRVRFCNPLSGPCAMGTVIAVG